MSKPVLGIKAFLRFLFCNLSKYIFGEKISSNSLKLLRGTVFEFKEHSCRKEYFVLFLYMLSLDKLHSKRTILLWRNCYTCKFPNITKYFRSKHGSSCLNTKTWKSEAGLIGVVSKTCLNIELIACLSCII